MQFDMAGIDVSESEGEQEELSENDNGSIDGDESESSGSEEEPEEGDDVLSICDNDSYSESDDDSDDRQDSGVESPLLGGVVQQTNSGEYYLRQSQDIEQHGFILQESSSSLGQHRDIDSLNEGHGSTIVEQGLSTVSKQQDSDNEDAERIGSPPSPLLSLSSGTYSLPSNLPSSPSLSVSSFPLDSGLLPNTPVRKVLPSSAAATIPDTLDDIRETLSDQLAEPSSLLSEILDSGVLSRPTATTNDPSADTDFLALPPNEELLDNIKPYTTAMETLDRSISNAQATSKESSSTARLTAVDEPVDEGVFEEEEGHGDQDTNDWDTATATDTSAALSEGDTDRTLDDDFSRRVKADARLGGYGLLLQEGTEQSGAVQRAVVLHSELGPGLGSSSAFVTVVAELKEVRTMLQDLHKRMDHLELSLRKSPSPRLSSRRSSSPSRREGKAQVGGRGILSAIRRLASQQRGIVQITTRRLERSDPRSGTLMAAPAFNNATMHALQSTAPTTRPFPADHTPVYSLNNGTATATSGSDFAGGSSRNGMSAIPSPSAIPSNKIRIPASVLKALSAPDPRPPTVNSQGMNSMSSGSSRGDIRLNSNGSHPAKSTKRDRDVIRTTLPSAITGNHVKGKAIQQQQRPKDRQSFHASLIQLFARDKKSLFCPKCHQEGNIHRDGISGKKRGSLSFLRSVLLAG
ncbi:hypothetical protein BGX33_007872 [Mortierella sp. NVP41]|nr:hypothetical protein BGX33_007872 [Mortierella sp. NVP41]